MDEPINVDADPVENSYIAQISVSKDEDLEQLGSLTLKQESEGFVTGHVRSSARVSKKMRLDSTILPVTPLVEKKMEPKAEDEKINIKDKVELKEKPEVKEKEQKCKPEPKEKLETKPKRLSLLWSVDDQRTFFEALNVFGKDFDAIQNHFASKAKKKGLPEHLIKTKDQIRHFYYRTWNKISKYLKFQEDVELKKVTQELYGLINYGEMRKRIGFVSEKMCIKLNELVYKGSIQIRHKGKCIRIKTPTCRILRQINQLNENEEEVRLPHRIVVELKPGNNAAWCRVQQVSQNPCIKTRVSLQRRITSLLTFLEERWKLQLARHRERLVTAITNVDPMYRTEIEPKKPNEIIRVTPRPDANISLSAVNLSEYLTSLSLCLRTYQERFNAQGLDESLLFRKGGSSKRTIKKHKSDSSLDKKTCDSVVSEKKENESSVVKSKDDMDEEGVPLNFEIMDVDNNACEIDPKTFHESCSDVYDSAVNSILSLKQETEDDKQTVLENLAFANVEEDYKDDTKGKKKPSESSLVTQTECVDPVEMLARIKKGWTVHTAKTTTVGDLYLMFGGDGVLHLDYWWEEAPTESSVSPSSNIKCENTSIICNVPTEESEKTNDISSTHLENSSSIPKVESNESEFNSLSDCLKKLVSLAKMNIEKTRPPCPCGHVCNGNKSPSVRRVIQRIRPNKETSENAEKNKPSSALRNHAINSLSPKVVTSIASSVTTTPVPVNDGVFRRPLLMPSHLKGYPKLQTPEEFKAQLDNFPRFSNRRGRTGRPKNVVVQRQLPLLPKAPSHTTVTLTVLPSAGDLMPVGSSTLLASRTSNMILPSNTPNLAVRQIMPMPVVSVPSSVGLPSSATVPSVTTTVASVPELVTSTAISTPQSAQNTTDAVIAESEEDITPNIGTMGISSPTRSISPAPSISCFLDLHLTTNGDDDMSLVTPSTSLLEAPCASTSSFSGLLSPSLKDTGLGSSGPPSSPSQIFKDKEEWLNSEVADFSLSSLLGHLESPMKSSGAPVLEDSRMSSDVDAQLQCLMSESSVDYTAKFFDLVSEMATSNDIVKK